MAVDYNDHDLMADFRNGSPKAFQEVFDRYFDKLYLSAFRMTRDREEARDIVITKLNTAFQQHSRFTDIKQLNNSLYLSVRNQCISYLRSRRTGVITAHSVDLLAAQAEAANDELDAELAAAVLASVGKLPERSREVIVLYYLQGMKYREIAEKMQVSQKTVENMLRYALEKLRAFLGDTAVTSVLLVFLCASSALSVPGWQIIWHIFTIT